MHITTRSPLDSVTATCTTEDCGYTGTLRALSLHDCQIAIQGGRCEDYPCCGHTDGDGCQTLPEHTSAFYMDNPQFLHEPGSPEWYDAMERYEGEDVDPEDCDHPDQTMLAEAGAGCDQCHSVLQGPHTRDGFL